METQELHHLWALASWLQTFPEFNVSLHPQNDNNTDIERLTSILQSSEATVAVANVAEVICSVSIDSLLAKSPCDATTNTHSGTDLIWNTLLKLSAERARPLPARYQQSSNIPLVVLGNLLDCAVHVADKQLRRSLIGRIMTLPKPSQKAIMAMIEMRKEAATPASASKSSTSPNKQKSPNKSAPIQLSAISASAVTSPPMGTTGHGPSLSQARRSSSTKKASAHDALSRMNCTGVGTSASLASSVMRNGSGGGVSAPSVAASPEASSPSTPMKSSLRKSGDTPPRSAHSVAFGTPVASMASAFSPQAFDSRERSSGALGSPSFLSPGTAESPTRLQSLVKGLQRKNDSIQRALDDAKVREEALKLKFESAEIEHRQNMMRVEAESLDRIQEMQAEIDERTTEWNTHLAELQTQLRNGEAAQQELRIAKEELEVMHHNKTALLETTEKLRKYKDKVTELNDVKEALQKEQEAHGRAVDELVRLENEVQTLQPVKRQVEEYKIRAIEAEVKLVESQDFIRRMERQAQDDNLKHETLYKGVVMQKEQMEELQRRIHIDTENVSSGTAVCGVGDSLTELNPALKDELVRLRNENFQLRAFQAKRTEDSVQYLEESLEDAKRLADRYKNEFLNAKETLERTQSSLTESQHHADELRGHVQQWQDRHRNAETSCADFERQLAECAEQLDKTQCALSEEEDRTASLRKQVHDWKQQKQESDALSEDRLHHLQAAHEELQKMHDLQKSMEATSANLSSEVERLKGEILEHLKSLQDADAAVQKLRRELDNSNNKLVEMRDELERAESQLAKSQKNIAAVEDELNLERNQRQEDAREAQVALETTRELLETKNRKEQEELQANMTRLLDDERKANRIKDEKAADMMEQLENNWTEKYKELQERTASSLKLSRQEAQERSDYIQQEHKAEIAEMHKSSREAHDGFIRKGRKMLEAAKADAAKVMQELHNDIQQHEEKNARLRNAMDEMEKLHSGKIASFKHQLEVSTNQYNELTQEAGESLDKIKKLEREKSKLLDENQQYRRQLSGRYGADGGVQGQLEKLQKEFKLVVDENRKYQQQIGMRESGNLLASIPEADDHGSGSYRRGGGLDQQALTRMRIEYEGNTKALADEKRDLIMRMSVLSMEVHKAEKRVWEHEEENAKLKDEITSLRLKLQRTELASETSREMVVLSENRSPADMSFHSARDYQSENSRTHSSPGIDRAKKQKLAQENLLRNRFSSITGSPPRNVQQMASAVDSSSAPATSNALVPLNQSIRDDDEHTSFDSNLPVADVSQVSAHPPSPVKSVSRVSKMASEVYRLGLPSSPRSRESNVEPFPTASVTQFAPNVRENPDDYQESCKQS